VQLSKCINVPCQQTSAFQQGFFPSYLYEALSLSFPHAQHCSLNNSGSCTQPSTSKVLSHRVHNASTWNTAIVFTRFPKYCVGCRSLTEIANITNSRTLTDSRLFPSFLSTFPDRCLFQFPVLFLPSHQEISKNRLVSIQICICFQTFLSIFSTRRMSVPTREE